MQFSTIVSRVQDITGTGVKKADLLKASINRGLQEATSEDLPYLMTDGVLEMVAPVTTGTVTGTLGSKAILGSGTAFTSVMAGRKIRIGDENTYYRISSVTDATNLTLENNFVDSTEAGLSFSIYKDEYKLPADLDNYKVFQQIKNQQSIVDIEPTAFDIFEPSPKSEGNPDFSILHGSKLDTNTTGTVAGTTGNSTIAGTNTSWTSVEGLSRGTSITVGSTVFTVKSVDNDTQLTIYEVIASDFSGSTPTILLDNLIIQFFQIPDEIELIPFKYQRIVAPLVSDQDIPDLPDKWHHVLITAGEIWMWTTKDKNEAERKRSVFNAQKDDMWKRIGHISKNRLLPRRRQDRTTGVSLPPRYDSNIGPSTRVFK